MSSHNIPATPFSTALVAGGVAGTAVDTLFFPIDTLKTRAQSQAGFFPSGGFNGVYRGLGSAVIGSAPGAAAFFTTYELLKSTLPVLLPALSKESTAPILHMMAASGGEVAACMIRVPTEVVKQRSQTGTGSTGSWDVAKKVWQSNGLRGFYRGFGSTVAREIPFTCLQFPMYERFKLILAHRRTTSGQVRDLPVHEAALCGSLAGGIAAGITTPLDVCKTRIMLSDKPASGVTASSATIPAPTIISESATSTVSTSSPQATSNSTISKAPSSTSNASASIIRTNTQQYPSSLFQTLRIIYLEEGVKVLFRGVVPRVIWISLGGAVFLGAYEGVKGAFMGESIREKSMSLLDEVSTS